MIIRHFQPVYQQLILFVVACLLPVAANSTTEEAISEKRAGVVMRMIGHEVLMSLGDCESRIMPIEKIDGQYKISFEFEFGFDPGDIVSIVEGVMTQSGMATDYFVEVEQCQTKEIVHSFEIRNAGKSGLIPCGGRLLPKDYYSLLITILDTPPSIAEILSSDGSSLTSQGTKKSNPFKSAFLIVPLLILIGSIGYFIKKNSPADSDPNLILIGASQFDKRNMSLSFEDKSLALSNKEAELLSLLHAFANAPVERELILQRVWGDEGDYVGRTLDVFISKLRKKLQWDASVKIVNIRGIGYKLVMDVVG